MSNEFFNTCVRIAEEVNHSIFFNTISEEGYTNSLEDYKKVGKNLWDLSKGDYETMVTTLLDYVRPFTSGPYAKNEAMGAMVVHILLRNYEPDTEILTKKGE